jgi:hypothetical protein
VGSSLSIRTVELLGTGKDSSMSSEPKDDIEPPIESVIPLAEIQGDDEEDTALLKEMAEQAIRYVRSYPWCLDLGEGYFGDGIGGIVGIFLFRVAIKGFDGYQWIWVFMGDIPSAYLLLDSYRSPHAALEKYIDGLEAWVKEAQQGRTSPDLIPIDVPPTPEHVAMARSRVASLREHILPNIRHE